VPLIVRVASCSHLLCTVAAFRAKPASDFAFPDRRAADRKMLHRVHRNQVVLIKYKSRLHTREVLDAFGFLYEGA
jgi:hypothetical protein